MSIELIEHEREVVDFGKVGLYDDYGGYARVHFTDGGCCNTNVPYDLFHKNVLDIRRREREAKGIWEVNCD